MTHRFVQSGPAHLLEHSFDPLAELLSDAEVGADPKARTGSAPTTSPPHALSAVDCQQLQRLTTIPARGPGVLAFDTVTPKREHHT